MQYNEVSSTNLTKKAKEPRFVPYEPYKAAVKPLVAVRDKGRRAKLDERIAKLNSNIDIDMFLAGFNFVYADDKLETIQTIIRGIAIDPNFKNSFISIVSIESQMQLTGSEQSSSYVMICYGETAS